MFQRGGEPAGDTTGRTRLGGGGDQLGGDAGEGAVEDELGTAAEIEREPLDPDLGAFRGIDSVQFALVDRNPAGRQPLAAHPPLAQSQVEPRALSHALVEVDPGPQGAGNRCRNMLQLSQFGDQRRDVGGLDPVERYVEIEDVALGEVAIACMQFGHAGAHRDGQRNIASDSFRAAFDRDIDPVCPPGFAGPAVVDDHRRPANAQPFQIIR